MDKDDCSCSEGNGGEYREIQLLNSMGWRAVYRNKLTGATKVVPVVCFALVENAKCGHRIVDALVTDVGNRTEIVPSYFPEDKEDSEYIYLGLVGAGESIDEVLKDE